MKNPLSINSKKRLLPLAVAMAFGLTACGGEQLGNTNGGLADAGTGGIGNGSVTSLLLLGGVVGLATVLNDSDDTGVIVTTAGGDAGSGNDDDDGSDNSNGGSDNNDDSDNSNDGSDYDDDSDNGNDGSDYDDDSDNGNDGSDYDDDSDNSNDGSDNDDDSDNSNDGSDNDDDSDNSNGGSDNNDDSDNGNGGSDNDDGSNNPSSDPEFETVPFLEAPDWLLGMWRGTGSNGVDIVGFVAPTDIGVSPVGMAMLNYSDIPGVCLHLFESNDQVFRYTIWYPGPNDTEVIINEEWVNNGDGSVLYTVSGATTDQFTMHAANASDYLAPPSWLQGTWASQAVNGSTATIADISAGNIVIGNQGDTQTDYDQLANQNLSVIRVLIDDSTTYSFELTTVNASGDVQTMATETFKKVGTNTITYTGFGSPATMTRQ